MGELIRYDAMCQSIAECHKVDEVKTIIDQAAALAEYARQARNQEAERQCREIRVRAEARWGELYRFAEKPKGAAEPGTNRGKTPSDEARPSTLAEMGVSYDQSVQWQALAELEDEEFEAALAQADNPSAAAVLAIARPKEPHPFPYVQAFVEMLDAQGTWLERHGRAFRAEAAQLPPPERAKFDNLIQTVITALARLQRT